MTPIRELDNRARHRRRQARPIYEDPGAFFDLVNSRLPTNTTGSLAYV